ncbi:MAG: hypothetical protein ACREJ2_13730 [Planctomycetota bacterium]
MIFFFHASTYESVQRIGYVADFCPICRDLTSWRIDRLGRGAALYGVEVSKGILTGQRGTCDECGLRRPMDPGEFFSVATHPPGDFAAFVSATHPTSPRGILRLHNRLELEARLRDRRAGLTGAERRALIREPFEAVEPVFRSVKASGWMQGVGVAFGFGILMVPMTLFILLCDPATGHYTPYWQWPVFGSAALCLALTILFFWLAYRSNFKRSVRDGLLHALQPIDPSGGELAEVIEELRRTGCRVARRCSGHGLYAALTQVAASAAGHSERFRAFLQPQGGGSTGAVVEDPIGVPSDRRGAGDPPRSRAEPEVAAGATASVDAMTRAAQIEQPFLALNRAITNTLSQPVLVGCAGVGLLIGALCSGLSGYFCFALNRSAQPPAWVGYSFWGLCGVAFVAAIYLIATGRRRMERRVYIALVSRLAPLEPTEQELVDCLDRLKARQVESARYLDAEDLWFRIVAWQVILANRAGVKGRAS